MGPVGFEPTTYGLKARSSAVELETLEGHPTDLAGVNTNG